MKTDRFPRSAASTRTLQDHVDDGYGAMTVTDFVSSFFLFLFRAALASRGHGFVKVQGSSGPHSELTGSG
ncbi:hypothetical protein MRX96_044345 [Rhipicephalus microplus]